MKLVLMSDTHMSHHDLVVPDGDVLVHAGDITFGPKGHEPLSMYESFNRWLGTLPHQYKIVIPGNHDCLAERRPDLIKQTMTNCHFLIDEEFVIDGVKFYGLPWTPRFFDWAFNADGEKMQEMCDKIPTKTKVLITHGPPFGILDLTPRTGHAGSMVLYDAIVNRIKPELVVFGHIHSGYGTIKAGEITFVNASIVDEQYMNANSPVVFESRYAMYKDFL
jgi:Icc-related predicted phosphoesterase